MRVGPLSTPPAGGAGRPRRGSVAFTLDRDEPAGEAAPDAVPASAIQAACLPALAGPEAADAAAYEIADAAAKRHGEALLHALAGLQRAVLGAGGGVGGGALAALAQDLPRAADPRLDAVLQAIAQRAAVELARGG